MSARTTGGRYRDYLEELHVEGKTCRLLATPLVVSAIAVSALFGLTTTAAATAYTAADTCGGQEPNWLGAGVAGSYSGPVQNRGTGETGTGTIALANAAGRNLAEVTIDVPSGKQVLPGSWLFTNIFRRGAIRIETEDGREGVLADPTCGGPDGTLVTGVDFVCAVGDDDCQFTSFFDGREHPWKRI